MGHDDGHYISIEWLRAFPYVGSCRHIHGHFLKKRKIRFTKSDFLFFFFFYSSLLFCQVSRVYWSIVVWFQSGNEQNLHSISSALRCTQGGQSQYLCEQKLLLGSYERDIRFGILIILFVCKGDIESLSGM